MSRAYLRLDPAFFDRKAMDQGYPAGAGMALVGVLCQAEHQPKRGRFRNDRVLKALLGPYARWIPFLVEHGDLVIAKGGELYVEGWDEWQEGDWKVGERVKRIRGRVRPDVTAQVTPGVTPDVTVGTDSPDSVGTVYTPSDGGRPAESSTPSRISSSGGGGGTAGHGKGGKPADNGSFSSKVPRPGTGLRPATTTGPKR